MWPSKKNHTKENKKWEYIHKKIPRYSEEEIKNKIKAQNKDMEKARESLKNIENVDKQNIQELEKNSEEIKNCDKEIREYEKKKLMI